LSYVPVLVARDSTHHHGAACLETRANRSLRP